MHKAMTPPSLNRSQGDSTNSFSPLSWPQGTGLPYSCLYKSEQFPPQDDVEAANRTVRQPDQSAATQQVKPPGCLFRKISSGQSTPQKAMIVKEWWVQVRTRSGRTGWVLASKYRDPDNFSRGATLLSRDNPGTETCEKIDSWEKTNSCFEKSCSWMLYKRPLALSDTFSVTAKNEKSIFSHASCVSKAYL
jgi:hypothetical protein